MAKVSEICKTVSLKHRVYRAAWRLQLTESRRLTCLDWDWAQEIIGGPLSTPRRGRIHSLLYAASRITLGCTLCIVIRLASASFDSVREHRPSSTTFTRGAYKCLRIHKLETTIRGSEALFEVFADSAVDDGGSELSQSVAGANHH